MHVKGHIETLKVLLSHGASVNTSSDQSTPLIGGCLSGCADTVELLLRHGAQVDQEAGGFSALMVAIVL